MENAGRWISTLRDAAILMAENVAYIRKELPSWDLPQGVRAGVVGLCDRLGSALAVVAEEIAALDGELRRHLGGDRPTPGAGDAGPGARASRVISLLREEMEALHAVVTELERVRETDSSAGAVYVLVTESGANILGAFVRIRETLETIAAAQ